MKKLLFAGTFDPPTLGHLDLIRRAAEMGHITVGIFINPDKNCLFSTAQRAEMLRRSIADIPHADVIINDGYTADYARDNGYTHLIRGYRNDSDLAYERKMASFNLARGGIDTILLKTDDALSEISSTRVRAALKVGDDATLMSCLPPACISYLKENP